MQPLFGNNYVDEIQTGIAVRRIQSDERFVAPMMVPKLMVNKPSGLYPVFNSGDLNRDELQPRGPTAPAQKAGWRTSNKLFDTDARSLEYDLNDAQVAASDIEINPEITIPTVLAYKANLHLERRMAEEFFSVSGGVSTVWYRTVTGAGSDSASEGTTAMNRIYMDNASADPIAAFSAEARILSKRTGASKKQMGLVFGAILWEKVRNSAKVKSQIVGVAGSSIGNALIAMARQAELEEFARLIGVRYCAVSEAIYNAKVMTSDATERPDNQYIVPEASALLFVNPVAGMETANAIMTPTTPQPPAFARAVWSGVSGANGEGVQIRRFRKEDAGPGGSWAHVIDVYNGFVVVTDEAGTLFTGMVTP
jgi:hypothetical protein